jgi:hypothetical protein
LKRKGAERKRKMALSNNKAEPGMENVILRRKVISEAKNAKNQQ